MIWTALEINQLRIMWERDGLQMVQIAERMGVTKGVIAGKINRLGFKKPRGPTLKEKLKKERAERRAERERAKVAKLAKAAKAVLAKTYKAPKIKLPEKPAEIVVESIDFATRDERRECAFVIGDAGRHTRCCGKAIAKGAYCAEHHSQCWREPIYNGTRTDRA